MIQSHRRKKQGMAQIYTLSNPTQSINQGHLFKEAPNCLLGRGEGGPVAEKGTGVMSCTQGELSVSGTLSRNHVTGLSHEEHESPGWGLQKENSGPQNQPKGSPQTL